MSIMVYFEGKKFFEYYVPLITDDFVFTSFGTFDKETGGWVCDSRYYIDLSDLR